MPTHQQIRSIYHYTPHKKEAAFYEDNKQQCRQFLLLNVIYIFFVFKIFIDRHFVTPKIEISMSPHN
jgi:hypothetical protein